MESTVPPDTLGQWAEAQMSIKLQIKVIQSSSPREVSILRQTNRHTILRLSTLKGVSVSPP